MGFDLDGDGSLTGTVALTIEYDPDAYPETNGYYGSYLDLYLAEFTQNLQWYLDNLAYGTDWTWFDADGNALSDEAVAAMTSEEKAQAFLEGRYAKGASASSMGGMRGGMGQKPEGELPEGTAPEGKFAGELPEKGEGAAGGPGGRDMIVGTPDAGTTQAAGSTVDSNNYATYEEMLAAYQADIAEIEAGDEYGNNLVELYNPLNYIGNAENDSPVWVRMMCGAAEGDISMFNSLNLQIAMLNAGIDAELEWQWDGGHVPSEVLGSSFSLYVDEMVGEHGSGTAVTKPAAEPQTTNGTATEATGTDLSAWVSLENGTVSFSLADAAAYRTAGASKAMPGFDAIDYGQEDYVFGDETRDARHWDRYLLNVLETYADTLAPLFNSGAAS